MDLAIAIRTLVTKGDTIYVQAGPAWWPASIPAAEYEETVNKARGRRCPPSRWRAGARRRAPDKPKGILDAMLLVIDTYDSFTYNLVQYLGELGQDVKVIRNDEIAVLATSRDWLPATSSSRRGLARRTRRASAWPPSTPTPGRSRSWGCASVTSLISARPPGKGHPRPRGDARQDVDDETRRPGVFAGLPNPFEATRYHAGGRAFQPAGLSRDRSAEVADEGAPRDHGPAPQDAAHRGRAVPPGVVPDPRWQGSAAQLPDAGRAAMTAGATWPGRRGGHGAGGAGHQGQGAGAPGRPQAICRPTSWRRCWATSWTARRRRPRSAAC